jgi:hypothetical protein
MTIVINSTVEKFEKWHTSHTLLFGYIRETWQQVGDILLYFRHKDLTHSWAWITIWFMLKSESNLYYENRTRYRLSAIVQCKIWHLKRKNAMLSDAHIGKECNVKCRKKATNASLCSYMIILTVTFVLYYMIVNTWLLCICMSCVTLSRLLKGYFCQMLSGTVLVVLSTSMCKKLVKNIIGCAVHINMQADCCGSFNSFSVHKVLSFFM